MHLSSLILAIADAENGIVLIDDIDHGLHTSVLEGVWQSISRVSREFNTQVFATTHSWECVVAAHEAFSKDLAYDFRLHRLDRVNGDIKAVTYEQEELESAIGLQWEVR